MFPGVSTNEVDVRKTSQDRKYKTDPDPNYICTYVGKVYVKEVYYVGKTEL